ncbi:unnamed protein product [Amoebophrya sp. A120]|nr:unnamed protein product [Amoebophrya sp. A120]|eukprot:GSA120T00003416001.1
MVQLRPSSCVLHKSRAKARTFSSTAAVPRISPASAIPVASFREAQSGQNACSRERSQACSADRSELLRRIFDAVPAPPDARRLTELATDTGGAESPGEPLPLPPELRDLISTEMDAEASAKDLLLPSPSEAEKTDVHKDLEVPESMYHAALNAELVMSYENVVRHIDEPTAVPLFASDVCVLLEHFRLIGRKLPKFIRRHFYDKMSFDRFCIDSLSKFCEFGSPWMVCKRRADIARRVIELLGTTTASRDVRIDEPAAVRLNSLLQLHKALSSPVVGPRKANVLSVAEREGVREARGKLLQNLQGLVEENSTKSHQDFPISDLVLGVEAMAQERDITLRPWATSLLAYFLQELIRKDTAARAVLASARKKSPETCAQQEQFLASDTDMELPHALVSKEFASVCESLTRAGPSGTNAERWELTALVDVSLADAESASSEVYHQKNLSTTSLLQWATNTADDLLRNQTTINVTTPANLASILRFLSTLSAMHESDARTDHSQTAVSLVSVFETASSLAQRKMAEFSFPSLVETVSAFARIQHRDQFLLSRLMLQLPRLGETKGASVTQLRLLLSAVQKLQWRSPAFEQLVSELVLERTYQKATAAERKVRKEVRPAQEEMWTGAAVPRWRRPEKRPLWARKRTTSVQLC